VLDPISDKDAFVETCIQALERLDLEALVKHPPKVTDFMQAYVLARCIYPVIMRRPKTSDWRKEERFDDELGELATLGEQFLDAWKPMTVMEAALMLNVVNGAGGTTIDTERLPGAVGRFLFEQAFGDPLSNVASQMLIDFSSTAVLTAEIRRALEPTTN